MASSCIVNSYYHHCYFERIKYAVLFGCRCEGCKKAMKVIIGNIDVYEQTYAEVFELFKKKKIPLKVLDELQNFEPSEPSEPSNNKYGCWIDETTIFGKFWDAIENAVKAAYPDKPYLLVGVNTHLVFYTYIQLWRKSKLFPK
jgi:hypothetical protein